MIISSSVQCCIGFDKISNAFQLARTFTIVSFEMDEENSEAQAKKITPAHIRAKPSFCLVGIHDFIQRVKRWKSINTIIYQKIR